MGAAISELEVQVRARDMVSAAMGRAGEGVNKFASQVKGASARMGEIGRKTSEVGRKMSVGFTLPLVAAGVAIVKSTADAGDRLDKLSQRVGVSVENLSALKFAAEQGGASMESLETGFRRFAKTTVDAGRGMETYQRTFRELGITITNTDGSLKGNHELMLQVADTFKGMEDGARKTALAQELFGRSGTELIPLLNEGRAGIAAMTAEAEKLGAIWSGKDAKAAAEFNDQLNRVKTALAGASKQIAVLLLPALQGLAVGLQEGLQWFQGLAPWIKQTIILVAGLFAVLGPIVVVLGAVVSGAGALIGAFTTFIGIIPAIVGGITAIGAALGVSTGGLIFILGGIVAAVLALKFAWDNNLGGIADKTTAVVTRIREVFTGMIDDVKTKLNEWFGWFATNTDQMDAGAKLGTTFTSGINSALPQAEQAKAALTDMTGANAQQLEQERIQGQALIAQRQFDNMTKLEQLQFQKEQELEMLNKHGLSTLESEVFWNEQINAIKNESAIKAQEAAIRIHADAVKLERDAFIGKIGLLKENMAAEIELLEAHGLSTWEVRSKWMKQIRDEEARVEKERTDEMQRAVDEQAQIVKGFVDASQGHFEKFWIGLLRGEKNFNKSFMEGVRALLNKVIDAYVQFIQAEMIKEIAKAQIAGPLSFGASLAAIGGIAAAGAAAKAALNAIKFAEGGIVNKPTLGIVGEAGPEAIIPLSKAGRMGMGGGSTIIVNVTAMWDISSPTGKRQVARKLARDVKDELAFFGIVPA